MEAPPSFKAEIYYLVAKFLDNGPCQNAAQALRQDLESHELVPMRYDWKGNSHRKTFRDMEDEFGQVPHEFLLQKCFELCSRLHPGSVRSLLRKEVRPTTNLLNANYFQRLYNNQVGLYNSYDYQLKWHSQMAKNMKLLRRTFGHLSSVYCLIFDRSGKLIFTGADDMLVKCWSFTDGRLIHTFRGASSEISDLAISHDNKLLAAGSCDKVIRVWELHTANPVAVLTKHTGTITAINFCPYLLNSNGSRYLASTSGDGTVSFWRYTYNQHGHTEFDELPTRYHEKIRPGSTQMICASFSPGGVFFCVGSADHNVRVYKMNGADGPIRILEEELHEDRVDSIQWCNTPNELRFLSGSRDGTARIWSFSHRRWTTLVLNMKTGDNREPSLLRNSQQQPQQPPRQQAVSRSGRQINTEANNSDSNQADPAQTMSNNKKMKSVTMVSWSLDDSHAITAVSDLTLKIWDSHKGTLLFNLTGHEDEIFVLEPHPYASNLLLTAAHDGHIIIWDLDTKTQVFKHRNLIEEQGNTQGHGPVFDAKWSKDGTTICASDSHGHILFISHGSSERYNKCPTELFFHTDYRPLLRDSFHNVVDEQTQLPPHLLPPPFLVDSEGDPYPAYIQRLVRGRENMNERDALVPIGPEPSFQAPHQHLEEEQENQNEEPQNENPEERLNRFRNEMLRNLPNRADQPANNQNNAAENEAANNESEEGNVTNAVRASKLVILNEKTNAQEILEGVEKAKASSMLESALFIAESNKDGYLDHDYSRPSVSSKDKAKQKSRKDPRNRQRANQPAEEEEEEEEPANPNENNEDNTTDCSLDESDFSSAESTTGASSEHSDWGSDNSTNKQPEPNVAPKKKSSPKEKKRRNAAQKCRERMLLPDGPISEQFIPSAWLSEAFPRKTPYFPQIGDVLMYFKSGHEKYIELVELRKAYKLNMREQQWRKKKNLDEATMVKVLDINFEIRPPRLCVLKLSILNQSTSKPTGETVTIKYHDMNDVVDFLVLYQAFNSHKGKHWKKGDRIRCQIDDRWWKGTVQKAETNKESPFLSIFVHWDNGDKEYLSPWDLESLDNDTMEITDGEAVSVEQLKKSLYIPTSEEWNSIGRESECTRISEALASIMELAIAEPFNLPVDLTLYPEYMLDVEYPMDLSLIKARVENHFYRRIDAIKHDIKYIYSNAASFNRPKSDIVRNAKIIQNLALEIVGDTAKTKDDVSAIYHRLVESFEWSEKEEEEEDSDEDDDANENGDDRDARSEKRAKKKNSGGSPPNLNPKKWKHDCNELLTEMSSLPFSVPFREPVSEIDFPDYHRFVATPMDLSTVRESLHIGDYNSPLDFQKDIKLVFKNSKEYNTNPKSKVLSMTIKLEEWFESRIGALISDWRNTMRRLTIAKRKHKAKKQENSYSGKGKGKGKGQSNKRSKKKDSSDEDDNESDDEDDEDDDDENDEDFINPKPGPSSKAVAAPKPTKKSTAAPPLKNAMTEVNAGRRTSSRQSRIPLRFQEDNNETDAEDDKPLKRNPSQTSTSSVNTKKVKTEEDDDDDDDDEEEEEEKPLARRRKTPDQPSTSKAIKPEDEEDEPLVKRANPSKKKVIEENSSDEDIPLAVIKKSPLKRAPSRQSTRPPKPSRRYQESESEDEQRLSQSRRLSKSSKSNNASRRSSRRQSSGSPKRKSRRAAKRKPAKRARYENDDDESESESEETSEESLSESEGGFTNTRPRRQQAGSSRMLNRRRNNEDEESEEEILPQRKRRQIVARSNRIRLASTSSTSNSQLPSRRNVKRPANYVESEEELPRTRRSRSSGGGGSKAKSSSKKRKKTYEEESFTEESSDDDDNEDEDSDGDSSDSSSREKAHLRKKSKKATVTSRGRVSKPNPRIS